MYFSYINCEFVDQKIEKMKTFKTIIQKRQNFLSL